MAHRRLDWLLPSWLEDASAYDQSIDEDMSTVYYTIAVNVVICSCFVLTYSFYRQHNNKMYTPKADLQPAKTPPLLSTDSLFGWVYELYMIDDEVVIDKAGFDSIFLIRFYRLAFKIFFFFGFYAFGVLLPINGTSGDSTTDTNSFELYSMTNIPQGSIRCWFHLVGMFMLTGIAIYFLEKEMVVYAKYRHIYLRQRHAHLRTVLVEGIPDRLRSTVTLATYLETLYPNSIHSVRLGQDLRYLDRLVQQRVDAVTELERCLYINHYTHVRPKVAVGNMLQEVDAIRHYTQLLADLNKSVRQEQEVALRLANHEDTICGKTAFEVIESFLEVTEIGSVKRFLKAKTGSAEKWMLKSRRKKRIVDDENAPGTQSQRSSSGKAGSSDNLSNVDKRRFITSKSVGGSNNNLPDASNIAESDSERQTELSDADDDPFITESGSRLGFTESELTRRPGKSSVSAKANDSQTQADSYQQLGSLNNKDKYIYLDMPPSVADDAMSEFNAGSPMARFKDDIDDDQIIRKPRILNIYEVSWGEWVARILSAPSLYDCWRIIKSGRVMEDHGDDNDDEEQLRLISPPEERKLFLSKAFVTFKTFTAATIARQVIHMQLADHLAISEAPLPTDIYWRNMYSTRRGLFWRRIFVELFVYFLTVVWVAPVTLISYVVSVDALRSFFPWVDTWCDKSEWFLSIVSLAQPAALVCIMNLLPPILSGLAILEGCISYSANQFKSFDRYFTFQVINVFLVTTIAGSVIDCIKDIYLNPSSTFSLLGESLPKMGGYFTNYMIAKAFIGLGMELVRFSPTFIGLIKHFFTPNLTPRDRRMTPLFGGIRHIQNPGSFNYCKTYAQDMLQIVICFTFACIAPLTLCGGLCYFAGASFIYKNQTLYVYEPSYETGGQWWPKMARCFVVAMLFGQTTLVGMMLLKETYMEAYCLGSLLVFTSFYYWHVSSTYVPLAAHLPFDMAASMDLDESKFKDELIGAEMYMQPSLRSGFMSPETNFAIELDSDDGFGKKTAYQSTVPSSVAV